MAEPDDLENRVAALETQVHDLTVRVHGSAQDAAAARVLAGGADRDVTEIRGEIRDFREQNTRVLNAMREDITDLSTRVDSNSARVDSNSARIDSNSARIDRGFAEMRGKFDATAAGQQQIAELLQTLIDRPDETSR